MTEQMAVGGAWEDKDIGHCVDITYIQRLVSVLINMIRQARADCRCGNVINQSEKATFVKLYQQKSPPSKFDLSP